MIDADFPAIPSQRRSFERIEATAMSNAARVVFVTQSACAKYRRKYPDVPRSRFAVIENGYDESVFETISAGSTQKRSGPLVLLHSGVVYPHERNPTSLFDAIALLRDRGLTKPGDFVVRFRAAGVEPLLEELAQQRKISDWIEIASPIGYRAALEEMVRADALILMQGSVCNEQIPAKLYEYLRAGPPIIGLADPEGDTGAKLRETGVQFVVALEDPEGIAAVLDDALHAIRTATARAVPKHVVALSSRRHLTQSLADTLNEVVVRTSADLSGARIPLKML
jgi:hypothetical protein